MTRAESCNLPKTEKTAVLWAAVQVPEIRAASQYFLKAEFSNASQIEALFKVSLIEPNCLFGGSQFPVSLPAAWTSFIGLVPKRANRRLA